MWRGAGLRQCGDARGAGCVEARDGGVRSVSCVEMCEVREVWMCAEGVRV